MPTPLLDRVILVVLDGVGVGALPDADAFGDGGANTLGNLAREVGGLSLPALENLGLGAVTPVKGLGRRASGGAAGRMAEVSVGKDSTTGHWELAGVVVAKPFPTFPRGFPREVIRSFEKVTGRAVLGNRPASGTDIIEELGPEHLRTGRPILYTSADSVLQLAAHEDVLPMEELYEYCRLARSLLDDIGLPVLRVIARPFRGIPGAFTRRGRKDFSLPPPEETVLEALQRGGWPVLGIGKVGELFCGRGLQEVWKTSGNAEGLTGLSSALADWPGGLIVANLLDFDTLFGHRNDAAGFAAALEEFDRYLAGELLPALRGGDLLLLTADHGCDPTAAGTDHSREYVPLIATARAPCGPVDLGTRTSFADVAATVFEAFTGRSWPRGTSFWKDLKGWW